MGEQTSTMCPRFSGAGSPKELPSCGFSFRGHSTYLCLRVTPVTHLSRTNGQVLTEGRAPPPQNFKSGHFRTIARNGVAQLSTGNLAADS